MAGTNHGTTFELADPAAQMLEEEQNEAKEDVQPQGDANDTRSNWAINGVGNTACNEHVSYKQEFSQWYWSNLYWLQGFITGAGYQQFKTLGYSRLSPDHDPDSMAIWVDTYCRENPHDGLAQVAQAFVDEYSE